ncbi:hypothetical protein QBC46DRAFT_320550 [Diplogelasinospora grovesii]|uniref:Uncharacterized protein n=1 Tax=Diplogelasinospora grovesii TaxID=303347 RepID=A0AAN6S1F6_9PEZI|nr:hypothetical protein QBC46DRAFT_320550 [Diplogelasinospora grovesii]
MANATGTIDPTQWNPHNVSSLASLPIAYLTELFFQNATRAKSCVAASAILPLSNFSLLDVQPSVAGNHDVLKVNADPASIDVGLKDLVRFANQLFPYPVNGSAVGDVATWWTNATIFDKGNATDFLSTVVNTCSGTYCRSDFITIGNPDIVGIGMLVATSMLLLLAFLFSLLSFGPIINYIRSPRKKDNPKKKNFSFRSSCVGTVDELFSAVFVFTISVLVSTFVFRYKTDARFDALMADGLSMFCSTTVVMLAATYWAHNRQRPQNTISVFVIAALTIALFATHFSVVNMHASPIELACGTGKGWVSATDGDPFDMNHFRFIPVGFAVWCLTLIGAVFHHPYVEQWKPEKVDGRRTFAYVMWKTGESLPSIFGTAGLIIYAAYFFDTWQMMKVTYGDAFTKSESTWGFGQYLALFTWTPPLLSFGHAMLAGPEAFFISRLPKGFNFVFREDGSVKEVCPCPCPCPCPPHEEHAPVGEKTAAKSENIPLTDRSGHDDDSAPRR